MKVKIIDWVSKTMNVKGSHNDILPMYETKNRLRTIDEMANMKLADTVDVVTKIYKRIVIVDGKGHREYFYANYDDAEKVLPIINSLVQDEVRDLRDKNFSLSYALNATENELYKYKARLYNKIIDSILRLFRRARGGESSL